MVELQVRCSCSKSISTLEENMSSKRHTLRQFGDRAVGAGDHFEARFRENVGMSKRRQGHALSMPRSTPTIFSCLVPPLRPNPEPYSLSDNFDGNGTSGSATHPRISRTRAGETSRGENRRRRGPWRAGSGDAGRRRRCRGPWAGSRRTATPVRRSRYRAGR